MDFSQDIFLIVEDDDLYRKFLSTIVERSFNGKVVAVTNPLEAKEWLENHIPFVIILDMEMPYMDGYTFTRWLRSEANFKTTPIIACSALTSKDLILRLAQMGISSYIQKNTEPKKIVEKIFSVIKEHKK